MSDQIIASSPDAILTKKQASAYLQVTTRTVERLVSAGLLKAYKPTAGLWRARRSELDKFLESGATIGGAE
jgi:excisionase family DNA binding protein